MMIKANELRIGNYINQIKYFSGDCDEIRRVSSVNKEGFLNVEALGLHTMKSHPIEWFNAITLTKEMLLKLGFVNEFSNSWSDHVLQIFENKGNVAGADIGDFYISTGQRYVCSFKHLHVLQNLYFALTGAELNTSKLF